MTGPRLHVTETSQRIDGSFGWHCRCGDSGGGFTDRAFARTAGDAHLAIANREPGCTCGQTPCRRWRLLLGSCPGPAS